MRDKFDPFLSDLTFLAPAKPINLTKNKQNLILKACLGQIWRKTVTSEKTKFKCRNDEIEQNLPQFSLQKLIYFCRIKRAFTLFHRLPDEKSKKLVLTAFILGDLIGVRT